MEIICDTSLPSSDYIGRGNASRTKMDNPLHNPDLNFRWDKVIF
jgi:hypothetical protein